MEYCWLSYFYLKIFKNKYDKTNTFSVILKRNYI